MKKTKLLLMAIAVCGITSCYNDNLDELHPKISVSNDNDTAGVVNPCDTTVAISYLHDIAPIMNSGCGSSDNSCHASGNTTSGITLDNYTDVNGAAIDGSLLGTILHQSGYSPMPKGGGKLDDCSINKIKSWINHGTPNN